MRAYPAGAGAMGAEARWEGGEGDSAPCRRLPGARGRSCGGPAWSAGPRRVICMLSRLRADTRARGSLARSPRARLRRRSAGAAPESLRAGESSSWRGREGTREGGSEGAPWPLSALPPALPVGFPGLPPAPSLSHFWETWDGGPRVAPSCGGGGPGLERRRRRSGARGGGRGGSEPEGSAQSCLSSCFYSHPERRSQKGAEPGRWPAFDAHFQLFFSSQLVCPRHPESPPAGPAGAHLPAAPDLAGQAGPELENMAQPSPDCRSPVGLDCCNCCLDLAHRSGLQRDNGGDNNNSGSPTVSNFRQLQEKLVFENLNTDKLNSIMRRICQSPCCGPLLSDQRGHLGNRNIDQTMLSILPSFFHR